MLPNPSNADDVSLSKSRATLQVQGPFQRALPVLAFCGIVALFCLPPPIPIEVGAVSPPPPDLTPGSSKGRRRARVQEYHRGTRPPKKRLVKGSGAAEAAAALAATLGFYLFAFHSLSNLPLGDPLLYGIHARFWMQPHIVVCVFAGCALEGLGRLVEAVASPARLKRLDMPSTWACRGWWRPSREYPATCGRPRACRGDGRGRRLNIPRSARGAAAAAA